MMNMLIYRYGSICEPDVIRAFQTCGLTVLEDTTEITQKSLSDADRLTSVQKHLEASHPLFVFSINFYPVIADICHVYQTPYVCWTVDSPVPELFSASILHNTNRIFLFDYAQYETFHPYNPDCIFYLPLASAVDRFDQTISPLAPDQQLSLFDSVSGNDHFLYDISFVGSLYSEKNPLKALPLSDYSKGYLHALQEASLKVCGYNPIPDSLNETVISDIKQQAPHFFSLKKQVSTPSELDAYVVAHSYIGYAASELDRIRTLNLLANYFHIDLFTRSDPSPLKNVHTHGGVQTLSEMPLVFHQSRINLNMTIKPIETGLPLRIFDICGCGGFVMTNYQSELTEYFEIGTDIEAYSSMDELVDKCQYYLSHEDERIQIARNGYEKVKASHTYLHRMKEMIQRIG